DIGRLTVEVLTAEPPVTDRIVFIAGDTVTYGQAADLVEEVLETSLTREVWTVPQLRVQLEKNPENVMAKYHIVFAEGRGVSWPTNSTYNHKHRLLTADLRQWLTARRNVLHRSSVAGL
ncbi:MAG TPA: hypothetical protein VIM67_07660, partial [Terriglobus sp.]